MSLEGSPAAAAAAAARVPTPTGPGTSLSEEAVEYSPSVANPGGGHNFCPLTGISNGGGHA